MDLVVLIANLGLDGTIADLKATEQDEVLCCLECATTLRDLVQKLVPSVDLIAKLLIDNVLLLIDIPQGLIIAPGSDILMCLLESLLELHIDRADVEILTHSI